MTETYSDGEAFETEAIERIRSAANRSAFSDLTDGESGLAWPVRYHLDPTRSNLLRPLDFSGLSVLDLGAGMGAAIRVAAETARRLVAVEASERRAAGLAARLEGLAQARVEVAPVERFETSERFDVVSLIGVLEHAERWIHPPAAFSGSPFDFLLHKAASFLATGGVLLLAIENRLGLKFWTGAAEEHTGRLFDGLAGYRLGRSERTFSRRELERQLLASRLAVLEWLYPFPDYKLPVAILSDALLAAEPDLAADLASSRPYLDPARPRLDLWPDPLACESAAQAGLLGELANSFLILASRDSGTGTWSALRRGGVAVAWHFPLDRRAATRTTFLRGAGSLLVEKTLEDGAPGPLSLDERMLGLRWEGHAARPIERGHALRLRILRRFAFGEESEALDEMTTVLADLRSRFASVPGHLQGIALDATLSNCLRDDGGEPRLFDLEWRLAAPIPASWWLLRNLLALGEVAGPKLLAAATLRELHASLAARLGIPATLEADLAREVDLAAAVRRSPRERLTVELASHLDAPFPTPTLLGSAPTSEQNRIGIEREYRSLECWSRKLEDVAAALEGERTAAEQFVVKLQRELEEARQQQSESAAWAERLRGDLAANERQREEVESWARSLDRLVVAQRATYAELEAYARKLEGRSLPSVLAVIVHPGGSPQLEHALRALLASEGVTVTVVLALNGGEDEALPDWIAADPRLHVHRLPAPLGFGAANNRAVEWAESHCPPADYVFFLNNDAAVRRDALQRMVQALAEDPQAGVAGPTLVIWGAEDHLNSLGLNLTRTAEAWDEGIGRPLAEYGALPGRRAVVAVTGAAVLVRAATWRDLGGWSELFEFYMEDLDLCLRASEKGWQVLQVPDAEVAHAVSATAGAFSEFKTRLFWRNRWVLLLLHWPIARLLLSLPRVALGEWRLYRRRLAVGAVEDARRQRETWREVFRLLPRIARERQWFGAARTFVRRLRPAGSVPVITLPAADQSGEPWSREGATGGAVR